MKFSIKDFSKIMIVNVNVIWSHLLRKSLMENFIFFAVWNIDNESTVFRKQVTAKGYALFFQKSCLTGPFKHPFIKGPLW